MSRLDALAFTPPDVQEAFEEISSLLLSTSLALYSELQPLTPKDSDPALREGAAQSAAATVLILEELRANLAMTSDAIVTDLIAKLLDFGSSIDLGAAGKFRLSRSDPAKRFDNSLVTSRLASRMADEFLDKTTGELAPVSVIVETVVKEMAKATGAGTVSYNSWRSTVLAAHGIDVQEYSLPGEKGPLKLSPEYAPNTKKPTEEP